jgi:nucleosome-remodeling factor subunit BPTF
MKKQELEDEKQKKIIVTKLQGALFKHKEAVKKEILKKRALMEKNLQQAHACLAMHLTTKTDTKRWQR